MDKQAITLINKFGNPYDLSRALKKLNDPKAARSAATIYKWTYARPKGTSGLIPIEAMPYIKKAARLKGIVLLPEDLLGGDI